MKIRPDWPYYIDEYKTLKIFLEKILKQVKNNKIIKIVSNSGISWSKSYDFSDNVYTTENFNYIVFDDESVIKFRYNFFSIIDIWFTSIKYLKDEEIEVINNSDLLLELDCVEQKIVDLEINRFEDEYIIEPSSDTIRPAGGDYFKEIIFHLSNNKKLCICAENAESDGYCNIWIENNNLKGVFNGQNHIAWWN